MSRKKKANRRTANTANKQKRQQTQASKDTQPQNQERSSLQPQVNMQDRYRQRQIRRQITDTFHQMQSTTAQPSSHALVGFLAKHLENIEDVRHALQAEKNSPDPWSAAIWRLLVLENSELSQKVAQFAEKQQSAIESAKNLICQKLPDPLILSVKTTVNGPDYQVVTPEAIRHRIVQQVGEIPVGFDVQADFPFLKSQDYKVRLCFDLNGETTINVRLVLDLDDAPEDCREAWESEDVDSLSLSSNIQHVIQEHLRIPALESEAEDIRLLKVAHQMGYWKSVEAQQLLHRWRASKQATKAALATQTPAGLDTNGIPVISNSQLDESEKLRVLDLPPLVAYDLVHANADMNVMQRLFVVPQLRFLKDKKLEDFTEADIRALSPTSNWQISDLRRRSSTSVDSRALAKILVGIARLQFERLEIGTCEADIRFCLSNYSTRMGEYLVQQHSRYDLARDYYLEAISLNFTSGAEPFPTALLFRSFPNDNRVPGVNFSGGHRSPSDFLRLLDQPRWQKLEITHTAIRSFLELGDRHFQWASRWFNECSPATRQRLLVLMQTQLGLGDLADLSDCVHAYRQAFEHFRALMRQMKGCSSLHGVVQIYPQFKNELDHLDFLLSPTNCEITGAMAQAAEDIDAFLHSTTYEDQRALADAALSLLERVVNYGADNYTALWAEYLSDIARQWHMLVSKEIENISKNIAPVLVVSLAETRVTLSDARHGCGQPRVIFRVENKGSGQADRINLRFQNNQGEAFSAQRQNFELRPNQVIEDYFEVGTEAEKKPQTLRCTVSYYDPDRRYIEFVCDEDFHVLPLIGTPALDILATQESNPFKTDQEVDDERMFVGRDQLLEEVSTFTINQSKGSLLMLYGQRRVGKSSLLLFLEREIDSASVGKQALGVRVTWLDYTAHTAPDLMSEIATAIQQKYNRVYGQSLAIPNRKEFRSSYSLAFNDMLRVLESSGVRRLVLMWDEFDGLVNELDNPSMGYNRSFFEYLRGLSKRQGIALVLTGGELMPTLFERWGEVFNHDRTWRIAYLSPTDGSVERLVRNEYVRNILSFSDDAIRVIKESSACNPFFVQMICRELVTTAKCQKSDHVCRLDVEEVVRWLVHHGLDPKYVRHLYSPRLSPDPLDMVIIGVTAEEEVARDYPQFVSQERILQRVQKEREDEAITRIGELVRREILKRNPDDNSKVCMTLPLFRDWFNDNKPEYQLWASLLRR